MQAPKNQDPFTCAKFVPANDESPIVRGSHIRGRGITGKHVASVTLTLVVREMRGCRIGAVDQENLEIRAIITVLARFLDCEAIESEVTFTEELVEEIFGDGPVVRSIHILPGTRD